MSDGSHTKKYLFSAPLTQCQKLMRLGGTSPGDFGLCFDVDIQLITSQNVRIVLLSSAWAGQHLPGADPSSAFPAGELSGTALGEGENTPGREHREQEVPEAAENGCGTSQESEAKQTAQILSGS